MPATRANGTLACNLNLRAPTPADPGAAVAALQSGRDALGYLPQLPAWDSLRAVPGGITAGELSLQLSGSFTNRSELQVEEQLTIQAAKGIDNFGAVIRAGGPVLIEAARAAQGVMLESGGDTTLKGAVITGEQVSAKVGGNLHIESQQDTSVYNETSKNSGFTLSVPIIPGPNSKPGASISSGKTQINSNYQSVNEQSGIKTGDGGFEVEVGGTTTLKGGVISSTQAAVDGGKNRFTSAGDITTEDIQNTAAYSAKGSGFTLGVGSSLGASSAGVDREK